MGETIGIFTSVLVALGGWETIKYFLNRRSEKKKSEAEADSASSQALKEMQEAYLTFTTDTKNVLDGYKSYVSRLESERKTLIDDGERMKKRIDELESKMRDLQSDVARNGRMVAALRPFLCGCTSCRNRQPMTITDTMEISNEQEEQKDINQLPMNVP